MKVEEEVVVVKNRCITITLETPLEFDVIYSLLNQAVFLDEDAEAASQEIFDALYNLTDCADRSGELSFKMHTTCLE